MASPPTEPATSTADAIKEIAGLASKAYGIEIGTITAPDGLTGVPAEIPVAIRHGASPEMQDVSRFFDAWRTRPERKLGSARALTLDSFIRLANRHKTGDSAVFADTTWTKPSFTAVIDYHENCAGGAAAFGKHRIVYAFPLSEEWKAWVEKDGKPMSQGDFASFLEDRIAELSSPTEAEKIALERDFATRVATPSDLIRLSRGLQVNVEATVKNAHTLQTGEASIQFEEVHKDDTGAPIKVPGMFLLCIAPFFMGETIRVPVRLRYRVTGGKLLWFYQIYRPDQYVTERVRDDLGTVGDDTGLPVYEGSPEMNAVPGGT